MKANFWQILGAILVVIGAAGYIYVNHIATPADKKQPPDVVAPASAPAATAPATAPLP